MNTYQLPKWDYFAKKILWKQLNFVHDMTVLDFGSGNGATADYFAIDNRVIAIEPSQEMLHQKISYNPYIQIQGGLDELKTLGSESFDIILCHNVLDYAYDQREDIINEFYRLLKPHGKLSIVKHNVAGRVMQMVVLLNDFEQANALLDGKNSPTENFGTSHYYNNQDIITWCPHFQIHKVYGLRTFWDLQQNQEIQDDEQWQDNMLHIEERVSTLKEYQDIAFFNHILYTKI